MPEEPVVSTTSVNKPKVKSTPSLKNILNTSPAPEVAPLATPTTTNKPVAAPELKKAWDEYADQRRSQVGEYQILQREYHFTPPVITVNLANPVEESLLENFRRDLLQFLRERLQNGELTIAVSLQTSSGKKVIYTAKEKFEHLAEKHPFLNELKDRLGLDWEY